MKIALIALAGLVPALASADDPKPYVVYQGRQVKAAPAAPAATAAAGGSGASANPSTARQASAFGTSAFQATVSPSRSGGSSQAVAGKSSSGARSFRGIGRSSGKRGIVGSKGAGAPAPTPASTDALPAYAVPGAKIVSAGQQPVYSDPGNAGTHSVEGGGFIAIDQSKARDVGRAPGITWAPPDTPPSASRTGGGGGTGASANGPSSVSTSGGSGGSTGSTGSSGPGHISGTGNGGDNNQGNNGNGSSGNGNNGGDQNNAIGFNPAF